MLLETLQPFSPDLFWVICVALGIAFLLAFSVGANDVSNSFGTSVGSRVLTVTQACILATIFEVSGATLLGYSVCDTFRKKMYDVSAYDHAQYELMLGALSCLIGSATWNLVATALKMPISGTHSIVGATIGFSMVLRWDSIRWTDLSRIVVSWFASPLISGLISSLVYFIISKTIIRKIDPLRQGLKALPFFYGVTVFINVASVLIDGPEFLSINKLPLYAGIGISLMCAAAAIFFVAVIMVPNLRRQIMDELVEQRRTPKVPKPVRGAPPPPAGPHNYDNPTFESDKDAAQTKGDQQQAVEIEEVTLDPNKLGDQETPKSAQSDTTKPPVALKPAHLRRQAAQDSSREEAGPSHEAKVGHSKFEEVDLSAERPKERDLERGPVQSPVPQFVAGHPKRPPGGSKIEAIAASGERYEIARLFGSLQIMTACFASFAHGTNDVSNAVAPLIPIWNIYSTGEENTKLRSEVWILLFGSIGICAGLWAWGRAVMGTISDGLTKITPSKGFSVELGAAISVLMATKLGLPISTTHCKVGSLVIVGFISQKFLSKDNYLDKAALAGQHQPATSQRLEIVDGKEDGVDWKMFGNIAITWIVTVPLAAAVSAAVMFVLKWALL